MCCSKNTSKCHIFERLFFKKHHDSLENELSMLQELVQCELFVLVDYSAGCFTLYKIPFYMRATIEIILSRTSRSRSETKTSSACSLEFYVTVSKRYLPFLSKIYD